MTYYEYTFTLCPASEDACDVLSAFLAEAGFETFETKGDGSLKAWVQQSMCDKATVDEACLQLEAVMATKVSSTRSVPEERDWNEKWERESFTPIIIDGRVHIHAPWQETRDVEHDIVVEPRMAFGSGSHATTSLLIHMLLDMELDGLRVIDAGCGTGVLGIVCLERGASELLAYDIDSWSVENTQRNLKLNGLAAEVLEGDARVLDGREGYDLILANINRNILLHEVPLMMPALLPGGRLVVSGFYAEDVPVLMDNFARLGLEVEKIVEKDGWCAIIFALSFVLFP